MESHTGQVTRGIRDVVGLDQLYDCRPAINRAFHYSKDVSKRRGGHHSPDYLTFPEFRVFLQVSPGHDIPSKHVLQLLQALRLFFEFHRAFSRWVPPPNPQDGPGGGRPARPGGVHQPRGQAGPPAGGWDDQLPWCQWVGPIEDYEGEFRRMGGGGDQVAHGGLSSWPGPLPSICRLGAREEPCVG